MKKTRGTRVVTSLLCPDRRSCCSSLRRNPSSAPTRETRVRRRRHSPGHWSAASRDRFTRKITYAPVYIRPKIRKTHRTRFPVIVVRGTGVHAAQTTTLPCETRTYRESFGFPPVRYNRRCRSFRSDGNAAVFVVYAPSITPLITVTGPFSQSSLLSRQLRLSE